MYRPRRTGVTSWPCSGGPWSARAAPPTPRLVITHRLPQPRPGLDQPVPTLPMFHPSFLLRTPERKREAWRDLLALRARLDELMRHDER